MRKFRLYWRDRSYTDIYGKNIQDAMTRAGYGMLPPESYGGWEEIK